MWKVSPRTWQFLSVKCLSQILLVVTSRAYNLKKTTTHTQKKKRSNYLNQSAIECTFQWLVLRLLSQQCFPRANSPKECVRGSRRPRSQLRGKFASVIELPGTLKTSYFRRARIMTPCSPPGWQWKWQPGSSILLWPMLRLSLHHPVHLPCFSGSCNLPTLRLPFP